MSDRTSRIVGLGTGIAAAIAAVLSPLLALSYFATEHGARELDTPTVSAWADPARDAVSGLLTWAPPDRVYGTYWLLFWVLFASVFLCARAVSARRAGEAGRLERWGWRLALVGYGLGAVGGAAACLVIALGSGAAVIDVAFFALMIPAMAIDVVGSTLLGIAFLRTGYRPRTTAWLLAAAIPSVVVLPAVLGNLSLGLLPVFIAWAVTGWQMWRAPEPGRLEAAVSR
jgi:hypothetical protein